LANQNYPPTTLTCLASSLGQNGAAHCLLQAIALSEFLKRQTLPAIHGLKVAESGLLLPLTVATHTTSRAALTLSASAPGLAGVLRVELL
jgi:hypothetical protein